MTSSRPRPHSQREKSKWFFVDSRPARLTAKISGLNLQGTGKTTGFFFAKELKSTVFMLQLTIFSFSWQCSRTFDEFKEFYLLLRRDESLGPNRNSLNVSVHLSTFVRDIHL